MRIISVLLLAVFFSGCGGYSSPMAAAPQPGVAPAISELSPDNMNAGGAGFILTVNGNSFGTNAVVKWNGASQATSYVTGKQLTISVPAAAIATPGKIGVTVTNPATPGMGGIYGGGGTASATSNTMNFTVN